MRQRAFYFDSQSPVQRSGRMNATEKQTVPDVLRNTASACCAVGSSLLKHTKLDGEMR